MLVGRRVGPEHPRGHDEVGLVLDQRLEHGRDLGRVVLAVGVEGDAVLRAQLDAEGVTHPQGVAVAQVLAQHEGHGAAVLGDLGGLVLAAVDHDQRGDGQTAGLGRHFVEDGADVVLLLVGADEADDGGELQVGVAQVELPARLLDDAARHVRVGVDGGTRGGAPSGAQSDRGVAKTWRTRGSKCESGLVG